IGLTQLGKLPHLLARRREVAGWYRAALAGSAAVTLLTEPAAVGHAYFLFSVLCGDRSARERAAAALGQRGIETRICWPLLVYRQPAYAGRSVPRIPCPVAESVADRVLSLPIHSGLTHADVGHICDVLLSALV